MVNNDVIGSCGTCDEYTPLTEDDLAVAFGEKTAAGHEEPCAGCDEEGFDPCAGCNPCEGCVSQYCKGCTPCKGCEWYVEDDADPDDFEPYETAEEQFGTSDKIVMVAAGVLIGVVLLWGWGDPWTLARVVTKAALMAAVVFGAKRLINEDDWTFDYECWKTAVVALGSAAIFAFLERHLWVANIGVVLGIIALALRKIMPPKVYAAEGDYDESDDDESDEDDEPDEDEESDEDDDGPEDADLDDA